MSDLLPSLSSDEEDDAAAAEVAGQSRLRAADKKKKRSTRTADKKQQQPNPPSSPSTDDDDSSNDADEADQMDASFEFGGILGEDGGAAGAAVGYYNSMSNAGSSNGWSYETVLRNLERDGGNHSSNGNNGVVPPPPPPRMDVSALIEAKRKTLSMTGTAQDASSDDKNATQPQQKRDDIVEAKNDDKSKNKNVEEDGAESSSASSASEGSDSSDDDSDSSSSDSDDDNEAGDRNTATIMDDSAQRLEKDVLKTRMSRMEAKKLKKQLLQQQQEDAKGDEDDEEKASNSSENDDSDDSDPSGSDDDDESLDEHHNSISAADDDREEAAKVAAFFDQTMTTNKNTDKKNNIVTKQHHGGPHAHPFGVTHDDEEKIEAFTQLALSRPILRGVAAMGYITPTPIQAACIPVILQGRDVCASAVTGSGKTAAFLLPLIEKLLHMDTTNKAASASIYAVILTPTRELAAQCYSMMESLCQYVNASTVRTCLIVGGMKNIQSQTAELRNGRPNVIVATPGRLLDHVMNTTSISLDTVQYLVLDEADRLLDQGFEDEVHELVKYTCASVEQRQTLLFSATMNTKVDDLIKLSLKRPVRVRITNDDQSQNNVKDVEIAPRLQQEFIRIRAGNEGVNRMAILMSLLSRTYTKHVIVFVDQKVMTHRLYILCGLLGKRCTELHGNLTQQQRLEALESFRNGEVDIMFATDLVARGLDIEHVQTVINYEMPTTIELYIHRIGRTARAGRTGSSCTLISESRRHLMKEIMKNKNISQNGNNGDTGSCSAKLSAGTIRSRTVPPVVISYFVDKICSLQTHIDDIIDAEAVAKMDRITEMELQRAENIIRHSDEIKSRPQREWFQSNHQKQLSAEEAAAAYHAKQKLIKEKVGTGTHRMTRKKRRAREAREAFEQHQQNEQDSDDDSHGSHEIDSDGYEEDGKMKTGKKKEKKSAANTNSIQSAVRSQKRKQQELERGKFSKSLYDQDNERSVKKRLLTGKKKGGASSGDSTLFRDENVAFASSAKKNGASSSLVAQSSYHFHGMRDPSMKLGKKKTVKAFKSKSKYKRR